MVCALELVLYKQHEGDDAMTKSDDPNSNEIFQQLINAKWEAMHMIVQCGVQTENACTYV